MFDIVIENGTVFDGAGKPGVPADVGIEGERIAALGNLARAEAKRRIDAAGCVVAPGFIDVHTHHNNEMDGGIENIPGADNYLRMGVTTCVGGNCGGGPIELGAHLDRVGRLEIRTNYALLAGCNTARNAVLKEERPGNDDELARMQRLVRRAFEEGAIGLSSGVRYLPFLTTRELIAMSKVAAEYDSFYVSHIRDEGAGLLDAVAEVVEIARRSGAAGQVSHIKCYGKDNWRQSEKALALLREARDKEGLDVSADQYPYTGCFTGLAGTLFGQETMFRLGKQGGLANLLKSDLRDEARAAFEERLAELDDGRGIILAPLNPHPEFQGKTLAEYLAQRGGDPFEASVKLCAVDHISAIYLAMCEEDVQTYMQAPFVMVASDGHLRVFGKSFSHPRNFGTFPRVLARYVREERLLTLEEAVRKMTSFPADRLGFRQRGLLEKGKIADVTVFNPKTIQDTATFREGNSYPKGIELVLLAGQIALEHDTPAARGFGRVIRRGDG
ncbi:MAG: amidohydrolase family protein [Kiritimatiellae bacterium]|nr:amidohydrolase family protein [Kiritimatiellia bacterium]